MRCRPQSRAPAPRCFVLPSRSVSHATNFVGDIQWGAMQDFFSLFLDLCMDFIFTRCSVNTAILCAFGWCYNLFFLIHRAESITRCEKKIFKKCKLGFYCKKRRKYLTCSSPLVMEVLGSPYPMTEVRITSVMWWFLEGVNITNSVLMPCNTITLIQFASHRIAFVHGWCVYAPRSEITVSQWCRPHILLLILQHVH